ncbi:autophagy-like protein 7 [Lasallia pustulata]|uniref:Ubiquitin-like modifier-activating enzyme ATG7 n=1 Tax=Lasallia pustulata TaxID=136370 RepID=A0A1W5CWK3_9LECA|nr:autophagy-like protein 7 [Lasallia pustulata]
MLKFATFASDIELPFYTSLASHKINHDKLDDSARRLLGLYELRPGDPPEASCRVQVRGNALTNDDVPAGCCRAEGIIKNVNTIEDYRNLDKSMVIHRAGRTIWDAINDGTIYSCPSLLATFSVICFADLKKYKFTYQFAFPALHSDPAWRLATDKASGLTNEGGDTNRAHDDLRLTGHEATALVDTVQTWRYRVDSRQHGFFLAKKVRASSSQISKELGADGSSAETDADGVTGPMTPTTPGQTLDFSWVVDSLASFEAGFFNSTHPDDCFVCFADPSTYPTYPGWMLRNLLVLIRQRWSLETVQILCYRDVQARRHEARSIILNLTLEKENMANAAGETRTTASPKMPKVTGWERNGAGKITSKIASLGEYMDPQRLADQAVDLNLKLIKWRIAPSLDLERIKNTKCLLLGAGTLGSYVARNLLGWGVRKITFVDNGAVSFSNPVRQPLFDFKDCLAGGAKKALRAAEALINIYPGVDSKGYFMSVPMAGHPIIDEARTRAEFETLQQLVDEHDVLFLLMDTRESRWLPTVMGKAAGKIVMNAALGFDTFVVMRHGLRNEKNPQHELGCYFCNDVVAPADSMTDRTLDQQCTVTRPGIAAIASALLVELLVSILQHPAGPLAPAPISQSEDREDHPLGIIPHQIRGFLSSFHNLLIKGKSYDCCSACSDKVTQEYIKSGWEFVKRALNEGGYVEELSGLAEVQRTAEEAAADVQWDDDDEIGEDDGDAEVI